jgi:DNA mismatch repair ATPase MutS
MVGYMSPARNNGTKFIVGILDQTRTPLGKNLLKQWLHRPSTSLAVIQERQEIVSCFVNPENIMVAEKLHKSVGGLKGAPIALNRLRKGKATLLNWKSMVQVRHPICVPMTYIYGPRSSGYTQS